MAAESHHGLRVVVAGRLFVESDGFGLVLGVGANVEELAVGIEAISVRLPLLLLNLFLRLLLVEFGRLLLEHVIIA